MIFRRMRQGVRSTARDFTEHRGRLDCVASSHGRALTDCWRMLPADDDLAVDLARSVSKTAERFRRTGRVTHYPRWSSMFGAPASDSEPAENGFAPHEGRYSGRTATTTSAAAVGHRTDASQCQGRAAAR